MKGPRGRPDGRAVILALRWAATCALLAGACLALDPVLKCDGRTQYEAHRKCCHKCPPGQKVQALCSADNADTVCIQCRPGHFQDGWTKQSVCTPHRYCDQNAGLVVLSPGDAKQNVVCRCQDGTHCSSTECQSCRENKACAPGEGVGQAATSVKDTVCAECPRGFFSNVSSATAPCQPWSSCRTAGLVQKANGTPFSDVICEEPRRSHVLVLVLASFAVVAVALAGLGFWYRCLHHRGLPAGPQNKGHLPPGGQQPAEDEEACSAFPIQETNEDEKAEQEHP